MNPQAENMNLNKEEILFIRTKQYDNQLNLVRIKLLRFLTYSSKLFAHIEGLNEFSEILLFHSTFLV